MIKVLIADDSPSARYMLTELINTTSDMRVVGETDNVRAVLPLVKDLKPNVILMDLYMSPGNGIDVAKQVMTEYPTPIVIITGGAFDEKEDAETLLKATKNGALTVIKKPRNMLNPANDSELKHIIDTVRNMSHVRVIHHRHAPTRPAAKQTTVHSAQQRRIIGNYHGNPKIVGIGVSTGGPTTLAKIFSMLPADFPVPVVVVQHLSNQFLPSLVKWLNTTTELNVRIAQENEVALRGNIYFAPIDAHLTMQSSGKFAFVHDKSYLHNPSVNVFFESLARVYGQNAIGVLLTGMGDDGATALKQMFERGAFTIAQDEQSSIVFGMPQVAINLGAVNQISAADDVAPLLVELMQKRQKL